MILEKKIKTTVRYKFISNHMYIVKTITSISEDLKTSEPSYIAGGTIKWYNCFGKELDSFSSSEIQCYYKTQ